MTKKSASSVVRIFNGPMAFLIRHASRIVTTAGTIITIESVRFSAASMLINGWKQNSKRGDHTKAIIVSGSVPCLRLPVPVKLTLIS